MSYALQLHDHYAGVRERLFSGTEPAAKPRRFIVLPKPEDSSLPMIRIGQKKKRRRRDVLLLAGTPKEARLCPDWAWLPILEAVLEKHSVHERDVMSDYRTAEVVAARHELYYRMRTELSASFESIGRALDRDHTTIRHGYVKHKAKVEALEQ